MKCQSKHRAETQRAFKIGVEEKLADCEMRREQPVRLYRLTELAWLFVDLHQCI